MLIMLQFLIQSDFVTDASRQDLVRSSARNLSILRYVARAFVQAVSQFCQHATLRYQWMRYLPRDKGHTWDSFWTALLESIRFRLSTTPALWTKSHSTLRCIKDMRRLPSRMLDRNEDPLFPDLDPEQYLACEYLAKDLDLLKNYGLCSMEKKGFLARVRQDLDQDDSSLIRSPDTDDDWHSRVATILISAWPDLSKTIGRLELIPLIGLEWTSAQTTDGSSVYYSHANGYPIPTNLKLNLVDPQAEKNPHRKQLFGCLGVKEPQVSDIRRSIISYNSKYGVVVKNSRKHLSFLYLTAHLDRDNDDADAYRDIKLVDHQSRKRSSQLHTFFFPDNDAYGAEQLFRPLKPGETDDGARGLDVSFLHRDYMRNCPTQPEGEARTWKRWLSETRHVRDVIPLTRSGSLSEECLYVSKHRPEKFLGFLLKYWKFEGCKITENRTLTNELSKIEVLCENGDLYPLGKTYVPANELEYARRFLEEDEFFPWLKLDASLFNTTRFSELDVLTKALGFGYPKSELEFHLTILRFVADANDDAEGVVEVGRVYDLYSRIEARCHESATPDFSREMIRYINASHYRFWRSLTSGTEKRLIHSISFMFLPIIMKLLVGPCLILVCGKHLQI